MKKKQQFDAQTNRLINRLYRSKPRVSRQEAEPILPIEEKLLVPKVNLKQKLEPIEPSFRRSKVVSLSLDKKHTQARVLQNRSSSKVKSRMYSSVENSFEFDKTPVAVTEVVKPLEKSEANYLTPQDFMQIIKLDKEMSEEFCYLRRKDSPYNWQIVDFDSRDPNQYMVISKRGLTKCINNVGEFMSMEDFNAEAKVYNRLMEIDYFKTYKRWKNFSIWKRLTKMNRLRENIRLVDSTILISDEIIKEGINTVYLKCKDIQMLSIFYNKITNVMGLTEFRSYLVQEREKTLETIRNFDAQLIKILEGTCNRSLDLFKKRMRIDRQKNKETSQKKVPLVIGDETGKQMPYTEEATIKTQQLKLRNFIKLADYLVLTSKTKLFKNSALQLDKAISETNYLYAQKINKTYGRSCWIRIEIEENNDTMYFVPAKSDIKDSLEEILFETVMDLCKTHTQFLHLPQFEVYARQRDSQKTDEFIQLKNIINADNEFNRLIANFRLNIDISLSNLEEHSHILHESLQLLKKLRQLMSMNLSSKDSEFFRDQLTSIKEQVAKLRTIENETEVGLYLFDCTNYKKKVEVTTASIMHMLSRVIPELLHNRSRQYLKEINGNYNEIADTPTHLEAYFSFLQKVKQVVNTADDLQPHINDTIYLLTVAEQFGLKITEVARYQVSETNGQMIGLRRRLDEIGYSGQSLLEKFKKEIDKLIPTFDERLKQHEQKLNALSVYKNTSNVYEKVADLAVLSRSLKTLNKDKQDLNRYQQALALQQTVFENIDRYTNTFGYIEKLWKAKYDWDLLMKNTAHEQIKSLKLTVIKLKIVEMDKIIAECQRELEPNEVISDLKLQVDTYKPLFQVLNNLNDEALEENHREEIRQLIVVDCQLGYMKVEPQILNTLFKDMYSEVLTTEFLREIQLAKHHELVQEITTKANKQAELLKLIGQVEIFWKSNSIQVVLYKDNKDSFILGNNDELIARIQDNLIITNNILASKYVVFIKTRVELQSRMLHYIHDLIDEWYHHQYTWMYLEPILKSPFAIKNLPKQSNTFAQADTVWKRIMKQARDNPSVKKYGEEYSSRFTLNQLRNNNTNFELLQKSLEEFLQKKREIFGRFFLLSNMELLEILSNVKEHRDIERYLGKVFQSVANVVIDDKDNITGLKGTQGEIIPIKTSMFKGEVQEWFKLIQQMMKASLRTIIKHEMATYNSENLERSSWIKSNPPCQVMLIVDSLSWTTSTELFLESEEGLQFYDWVETNNAQVDEQINLLKQLTSPSLRMSLTNLIHQNIRQRDITESLVGCESKEDFRWQVRLRFYYEDDIIHAKVANAQTSYGYQYVGMYECPVGTAESERYWFAVISCISKQKVAVLQGKHQTGKTQTYRQLAHTLAKNSMVFNCSENVSPSVMRKLLTGVSYMGSWICFEEVTQLSEQVLSVFAQSLFQIQEALIISGKQVRISDKPLLLNPDLGLVMTMKIERFTAFPSMLLSELRPMAMWIPDKMKIFETLLMVNRIADYRDISRRLFQCLDRCRDTLSEHPTICLRDIISIGKMLIHEIYQNKNISIERAVIKVLKSLIELRLVSRDLPMFKLILSEAFPINAKNVISMESIKQTPKSMREKLYDMNLIETEEMLQKIQQFLEMCNYKSSVIITGNTMCGKTSILKVVFDEPVFISPNCYTNEELFGRLDQSSGNWKDGLIPKIIRQINREVYNVFVLDGKMSSYWAEAIAPILDPSHSISLANSQKLNFEEKLVKICFECAHLSDASPAVLSRCGVLYISNQTIGYEPIIESIFSDLDERIRSHIISLIKSSYKKGIAFLKKNCREMIVGSPEGLLLSYCKLIKYQLKQELVQTHLNKDTWKKLVEKLCIFAFTWSLGGVISVQSSMKFDKCLSECFSSDQLKTPMFNYVLSYTKAEGQWVLWSSFADAYQSEGRKFIPTKETAIMRHLTLLLMKQLSPMLLMSPQGNGKTTAIRNITEEFSTTLLPHEITLPVFSYSKELQQSIESKLQPQRRMGIISLLPPPGQKLICVIDDVNLAYSSNASSIELLRSLIATNLLWDRKTWTAKTVLDYQIIYTLSCDKQINNLPDEFLRYFNLLCVPPCEDESIHSILNAFSKTFPAIYNNVQSYIDSKCLTTATIELFAQLKQLISNDASQPQLTFNMHHMLKIFKNIERTFNPNKQLTINNVDTLIRAWIHELRQTVVDRLPLATERSVIEEELKKKAIITLKYAQDPNELFAEHIVFCPINMNHYYSHVPNPKELLHEFSTKLQSNLVLSWSFADHLFAAVRALSQQRGNYMAIGLIGEGRSTIIRCAARLLHYTVYQILPTTKILTVLKKLCEDKKSTVLLLSEASPRLLEQLVLLPRLSKEDQEEINKITTAKSFAEIIEKYLHIAVTYSPAKETFTKTMRTLPCLTTVFQIDYWLAHTNESLNDIASGLLHSNSEKVDLKQVGRRLYQQANMQSIGLYIDLFRIYKYHNYKQKELTERRIASLSKAINKFELTVVKLKSISAKMYQDIPKKQQVIQTSEEWFSKLQQAQLKAIQFKQLLDVDEKVLQQETLNVTDEKRDLDRTLAEIVAPVEAAANTIANLSRNDVSQMKQLFASPNTPADLKFALDCVAIALQQKQDADFLKKMINDANFTQRFKQYDIYNIPKKMHQALRAKLGTNPNFKPSQMKAVNAAVKCFCQWLWTINSFPERYKPIEERKQILHKMTDKMNDILKVVTDKRAHMDELNAQIRQFENQYHQCVEEKQAYEKEIATAAGQLERGEALIESSNSYCQRWKVQLHRTQILMETLQHDVFYACCEMVMLSRLDYHAKQTMLDRWRNVIQQYPQFRLRENYSLQSVLTEYNKYERIFYNNSLYKQQSILDNLLYLQKSLYPLVMVDPYSWALDILSCDNKSISILKYDSANFESQFGQLMKNEKTTCIVHMQSVQQLNSIGQLLPWNFREEERPEHVGKQKVFGSPSFRWHFLVSEEMTEVEMTGLRLVNMKPSRESILHQINLCVGRSEKFIELVQANKVNSLMQLENHSIVRKNEWYVLDAYQSVASELFEQSDIILNIQKCNKTLSSAIEQMESLQVQSIPVRTELVQWLYQIFLTLEKIRPLRALYLPFNFHKYTQICTKLVIDAFNDHLATMQATANLYKQLSRHVLTRKHLTVLFFELSLNVGLRNGTITKEHVNLLTNALNIHCSRQIFTELVVITKWLNSKLKDWQLNYFWQDPLGFCHSKEWAIAPIEQIICLVHIASPDIIPTIWSFIQIALGLDININNSSKLIGLKSLYSKQQDPIRVIDLVDDTAEINVVKEVQKFSMEAGLSRLRVYSLGDKDMHNRIDTSIKQSLVDGGWTVLSNCHLQQLYTKQKIQQIKVVEKIHDNFRLTVIHNSSTHIDNKYHIKSSFTFEQQTVLKDNPLIAPLVQLHLYLNERMQRRFRKEDLLNAIKLLEPVLKRKKLEDAWLQVKLVVVDYIYFLRLTSREEHEYLSWIFDEFKASQTPVQLPDNQIINAVELNKEIALLHPQQKSQQENKYSNVLNICENLIGRLPLAIKKRTSPTEKPVVTSGPDYLENFIVDEAELNNSYIKQLDNHLNNMKKALKGQATLDNHAEAIIDSIARNDVPTIWKKYFSTRVDCLTEAFSQFLYRCESIRSCLNEKTKMYDLKTFTHPAMFLEAVLFTQSRKKKISSFALSFDHFFKGPLTQKEIAESDGCYIRGLLCRGFTVDIKTQLLKESLSEREVSICPTIHFKPVDKTSTPEGVVELPLFASTMAGDISKLKIKCRTTEAKEFWTVRKSCFLTDDIRL